MLRKYISVFIVLCLGVVLSITAFTAVDDAETQRIQIEFIDTTKNYMEIMQDEIARHLDALESLTTFYATTGQMEQERFNSFTSSLLARYPGIESLQWAPKVAHEQRTSFEIAAQEYYGNYKITERNPFNDEFIPATNREYYFPIYYLNPYPENQTLLGLDLASQSNSALEQARDAGRMIATQRFNLPQKVWGFFVFSPIYTRNTTNVVNTVVQRRQHLLGYVVGIFSINHIVENALQSINGRGIDIRITDESAPATEKLLYNHKNQSSSPYIHTNVIASGKDKLDISKSIEVAGRRWTITCIGSLHDLMGSRIWLPISILVGGLVFTILIMAYLFTFINRNQLLQKEILERKRIATELAAKEEEFRTFVNRAPVMLWMSDVHGDYLLFNETWLQFTGHTLAEELAKDWKNTIHPDDAESYLQNYTQAHENHRKFSFTYRLQRADGQYRWLSETSNLRFSMTNEFAGFIGACVDITEQLEAEKALYESQRSLAILMSNLPGMAYRCCNAPQWVMEFVSQGCTELTGYQPEELLKNQGVSFIELIHSDDRERVLNTIQTAVQEQRPYQCNYRITTASGLEKWVWEQGQGIFSKTGELQSLEGFISDITEQKHAEEALNRAKQMAEDANLAKTQFLANMSHELRTPLNAIMGYSELLQEQAEDLGLEDFTPDLLKIRASGKHLLMLINDILDISKIEAGKMELYTENFFFKQIVEEVVHNLQPVIAQKENVLLVQCNDNVGEVHLDLIKVRQVLMNLLSNATKFTTKGVIKLQVDRETLTDGEWVVINVSDTGIGITPEQQAKLFQIFMQADASTTRKYGGTGLGLAITHQFVHMMHGNVQVVSQFGEGSTFTVRLPVYVTAPQIQSRPTSVAEEIVTSSKVLVIDDDENARVVMHSYLARIGYQVITAKGGEEGLQLAYEHHPEAITLDIMMPDMDGWTVLSKLKADPVLSNIPVIIVSMVEDKSIGYSLGANDYLIKPVSHEQLATVLQKHHISKKV